MAATTQHRIQVTETPSLAEALDVARRAWPDERRTSRLIERLALEGSKHLPDREDPEERKARMRTLVAANPTHFPDDYLASVREGWR